MANMDKADVVSALAERLHDSVDPIAGQPEDLMDPPPISRSINKSAAVSATFRLRRVRIPSVS